jgi:hypothetical protein
MKKFIVLLFFSTMLFAVPNAPTNLTLKPTKTTVSLSWSDNSDDERGFKIFRDGKLIAIVNKNIQSYTDTNLKPNTNYSYEIKSSDDFGFKLTGSVSDEAHMHLLIDSDHNKNTGYSNNGILGADILIQNGIVFQKDGDSQTSWKWKKVGESKSQINIADHTMFITFDESELGGLGIDKDSTFQAFNFNNDYSTKTKVTIASKLDIDLESNDMKKVYFTESSHALKNPLKGFMIWSNDGGSSREYVSLVKKATPWNKIENSIADSVSKIVLYSKDEIYDKFYDNNVRYNIAQKNIKAIPIVLLKKRRSDDFSPSDMDISEHDNQTDEFVRRINNLIPKLAQAWDNDPHIGFVYMGIVGTWGEQYSTIVSPSVAKALGDGFSKYFKNKKVLVRIPNYFNKTYLTSHNNSFRGNTYTNYYNFGIYWDAFAWSHEMTEGGLDTFNTIKNAKLWQDQPILGEVAFNVNYLHIYDHDDYPDLKWPQNSQHAIHDTLTDEVSFDYLRDYIKATHATALSWISIYNKNDQQELIAVQKLQKEMGYRFVLEDAEFNSFVGDDRKLTVSFDVKNIGSAPFYYDWPVEIALLDKDSKEVVWSDRFDNVDIRSWKSGDDWDFDNNRYKEEAKIYRVSGNFNTPKELKNGEYILSVSILDPSSMRPSVKFAVTNYYKGGRTAIGVVGIGVHPSGSLPAFDDLESDGLSY